MADSKNWVFQPPPKAEQFWPKFHKLFLGWVGSIDAKGIHFSQSIWSSGCPTEAQFTAKNTKNAFLAVNWAYNFMSEWIISVVNVSKRAKQFWKKPQIGLIPVFWKKNALDNLIHINSYDMRKKVWCHYIILGLIFSHLVKLRHHVWIYSQQLKPIHFKKTVARISFLSKLWYFLFWFVLKVPQFWKKRDSRICLLKMNGLYQQLYKMENKSLSIVR